MLDAVVLVILASALAFGFYGLGRHSVARGAEPREATAFMRRLPGNRGFYVLGGLAIVCVVGLAFVGAWAACALACLVAIGVLGHPRLRADWYALGFEAGWAAHSGANIGGVLRALHALNQQMAGATRAVDAFIEASRPPGPGDGERPAEQEDPGPDPYEGPGVDGHGWSR